MLVAAGLAAGGCVVWWAHAPTVLVAGAAFPFGQHVPARLGIVEVSGGHRAIAICAVPPLGADTTESRQAIA